MNFNHHHISLLTGDATQNRAFYEDVLGLRFIKNSINQNNRHRRHIYYGDYVGSPGSVVTFFPVNFHDHKRQDGPSYYDELTFNVAQGGLDYWQSRLETQGITTMANGDKLYFTDSDGVAIALQESTRTADKNWTINRDSDIPAEWQILGIRSVLLRVFNLEVTEQFFDSVFGLVANQHEIQIRENEYLRFAESPDSGTPLSWGPGSVDHFAIGVASSAELDDLWERAGKLGYEQEFRANRGYFESIYLREPSGVRVEVATNGPGFTLDESVAELGTRLSLPGDFEQDRDEITAYFARQGIYF